MTRQHHFALLCVYFIALTTVLIQADPMASSDVDSAYLKPSKRRAKASTKGSFTGYDRKGLNTKDINGLARKLNRERREEVGEHMYRTNGMNAAHYLGIGGVHLELQNLRGMVNEAHGQIDKLSEKSEIASNERQGLLIQINSQAAKYERKMKKLFADSARIVQNLQKENVTLKELIDGLEQEKVQQKASIDKLLADTAAPKLTDAVEERLKAVETKLEPMSGKIEDAVKALETKITELRGDTTKELLQNSKDLGILVNNVQTTGEKYHESYDSRLKQLGSDLEERKAEFEKALATVKERDAKYDLLTKDIGEKHIGYESKISEIDNKVTKTLDEQKSAHQSLSTDFGKTKELVDQHKLKFDDQEKRLVGVESAVGEHKETIKKQDEKLGEHSQAIVLANDGINDFISHQNDVNERQHNVNKAAIDGAAGYEFLEKKRQQLANIYPTPESANFKKFTPKRKRDEDAAAALPVAVAAQ